MRKISVLKVGIIAATSFFLGACAQAADSKDQSQRHCDDGEQELSYPGSREDRLPDIDGAR